MYVFRSPRLSALFQEGEKKVETVQILPQGTSGLWSSIDATLIGLTSSYIICDTNFGADNALKGELLLKAQHLPTLCSADHQAAV